MADTVSKKKVLVALSGGVDSSVAAALLITQGYSVEAAYMRCWSEGPYCTADADQSDAARVASVLGIPFHVFDFERQYRRLVVDYFYREYGAGKTPNPDVMCNKEIKFGLFLDKALERGFDYIATGHYARVKGIGDRGQLRYQLLTGLDSNKDQSLEQFKLLAGSDPNKDQSYFLYRLTQDQLSHTLFPLGGLTKTEVRKLATEFNLPTAGKPDSRGICFIGPANVREFLQQKIAFNHGDIVSVDGKLLGRHVGLPFYTIGQREGVGVSSRVPYYVADKRLSTNTLVVAPFGHAALFRDTFLSSDTHWIAGTEPEFPLRAQVKLRYRAPNIECTVTKLDGDRLEIRLDTSERAITGGQSAVLYRGEEVIGGTVIE